MKVLFVHLDLGIGETLGWLCEERFEVSSLWALSEATAASPASALLSLSVSLSLAMSPYTII